MGCWGRNAVYSTDSTVRISMIVYKIAYTWAFDCEGAVRRMISSIRGCSWFHGSIPSLKCWQIWMSFFWSEQPVPWFICSILAVLSQRGTSVRFRGKALVIIYQCAKFEYIWSWICSPHVAWILTIITSISILSAVTTRHCSYWLCISVSLVVWPCSLWNQI